MFLYLRKISSKLYYIILIVSVIFLQMNCALTAAASTNTDSKVGSLYAGYAALLDAESGRLLYGKNADAKAAMASTTKIMTCIIALEYAPLDLKCTASAYAASMPEVKLYAKEGEEFELKDLLYSLILKSHNDSAVIIAESVAAYYLESNGLQNSYTSKELVSIFAGLMNEKAAALSCTSTYYITPNGLDASDSNGSHSTTAYELCLIMSYCIQNEYFLQISQTSEYSFSSNLRSFNVTNANTFMNMYKNVIAGKTGFTAQAGYCYVCAYKDGDRTLIAVVLASGWPYNKNYRWSDTKKLLEYGKNNFEKFLVLDKEEKLDVIYCKYGFETRSVTPRLDIDESIYCYLSESDKVNILYNYKINDKYSIQCGDTIGSADIYINDELWKSVGIISDNDFGKPGYAYYIDYFIKIFFSNNMNVVDKKTSLYYTIVCQV